MQCVLGTSSFHSHVIFPPTASPLPKQVLNWLPGVPGLNESARESGLGSYILCTEHRTWPILPLEYSHAKGA